MSYTSIHIIMEVLYEREHTLFNFYYKCRETNDARNPLTNTNNGQNNNQEPEAIKAHGELETKTLKVNLLGRYVVTCLKVTVDFT